MAKQIVNIGTADKGNGDPLRTAFDKVNQNFTELYTALGLNDNNLNLGSFEFSNNIISTTDSSNIVIDQAVVINSELTMHGDIVPNIANEHTLGTLQRPWKSLYVSNSTVFLGGVPLSLEPGTNELRVNNVPISQNITYADIPNAPTDVSDLTDTDGLLGGSGVISYNDLTDKPTLFSGSYNDLTNKPNLGGTYQFSVAADDSTQRLISADEVIKFVGAGGVTTASDAEGNITITGTIPSSLVNGAYSVAVESTGAFKVNAQAIVSENQLAIEGNGAVQLQTANLGSYITVWNQGNTKEINLVLVDNAEDPSQTWTFNTDRTLILPDNSRIKSATNIDITIDTPDSSTFNWQFGADGALTLPGGRTRIGPSLDSDAIIANEDEAFGVLAQGTNGAVQIVWIEDLENAYTSNLAAVYVNSGNLGSVRIATGDNGGPGPNYWEFNNSGALTFPQGTTIATADGTDAFIIDGAADKDVQIYTYSGETARGWTFGTDGDLEIPGNIKSEGNINIDINLSDSTLHRWSFGEDGNLTLPSTGKISNSGYDWTFGNTGALTLPAGGIISEGGGISGAIKLTPAGGANANQALLIYPTGNAEGDHVHLTAGGGSTELYLGNDFHYVKLVDGGNIELRSATANLSAQAAWTFETDGELDTIRTLGIKVPNGVPTDVAVINSTSGSWEANPNLSLATTGGSGSGLTVNVSEVGGYASTIEIATAGTGYNNGDLITVTSGTSNATFTIVIAGRNTWTFGIDGNLTLPNGAVLRNLANSAIAFGQGAGANNSQGATAIAIGTDAGYYTQGAGAVAIGESAGESYQGANAVAIGKKAGYYYQAANSIILNATGDPLEQTTANTFTVKPVRQGETANAMYYNSSTGEITYSDTFSFSVAADDSTQRLISNNESIKFIGAGKINTASDAEGNITITGADSEGSWTVTTGTNTYSFTVPMDGTYVMWVKGNIPNGIITWNATASVSNNNVPAIGYQYAWNYTGGGTPISLTSIPDQIKGTAGTISTDATYVGTTSNRFDFGISNTSGASQTVYYGYTRV